MLTGLHSQEKPQVSGEDWGKGKVRDVGSVSLQDKPTTQQGELRCLAKLTLSCLVASDGLGTAAA